MSDQGQPSTGFNFDAGYGAEQLNQPQQSGQQDTSLAGDFLSRVAEADREIVGKYIKDWDAGVTRRFQDLHARYQPYEELGDYASVQQAMQVYQYLQANPEQVYKTLQEHYGKAEQNKLAQEEEWADLPPAVVQRLQTIEQQGQLLQALAERVIGMDSASQEAREDAELDKYMSWLKTTYGEFDEDYVLAKMSTGMDGAQAAQQFIEKYGGGNQQTRSPFTVLSGGGSVGQQGQFDPAKASGQDVRGIVGQMLKLAAEQGQ